MRRREGASMVEMLVSMSILVIVLGLASAGVVMALRAQRTQEAVTSSQGKLRRVNEAVTQELRSTVLGGLTNDPYDPTAESVSFVLLDGGAGYQVSGTTNSKVEFIASESSASDLGFGTGQVLMVNGNGEARFLKVNSSPVYLGTNRFRLNHPACSSTFAHTPDTLLFKVNTVGFEYVAAEQTLYESSGGVRSPLAFDLSQFRIDYIYERSDGSTETRSVPYLDANGVPLRNATDASGNALGLRRLQVVMATQAKSIGGRQVERTYSSQIEMVDGVSDSRFRVIKGVSPC